MASNQLVDEGQRDHATCLRPCCLATWLPNLIRYVTTLPPFAQHLPCPSPSRNLPPVSALPPPLPTATAASKPVHPSASPTARAKKDNVGVHSSVSGREHCITWQRLLFGQASCRRVRLVDVLPRRPISLLPPLHHDPYLATPPFTLKFSHPITARRFSYPSSLPTPLFAPLPQEVRTCLSAAAPCEPGTFPFCTPFVIHKLHPQAPLLRPDTPSPTLFSSSPNTPTRNHVCPRRSTKDRRPARGCRHH